MRGECALIKKRTMPIPQRALSGHPAAGNVRAAAAGEFISRNETQTKCMALWSKLLWPGLAQRAFRLVKYNSPRGGTRSMRDQLALIYCGRHNRCWCGCWCGSRSRRCDCIWNCPIDILPDGAICILQIAVRPLEGILGLILKISLSQQLSICHPTSVRIVLPLITKIGILGCLIVSIFFFQDLVLTC